VLDGESALLLLLRRWLFTRIPCVQAALNDVEDLSKPLSLPATVCNVLDAVSDTFNTCETARPGCMALLFGPIFRLAHPVSRTLAGIKVRASSCLFLCNFFLCAFPRD
jgi:hypothetical protein